jgi:hypothetical protein
MVGRGEGAYLARGSLSRGWRQLLEMMDLPYRKGKSELLQWVPLIRDKAEYVDGRMGGWVMGDG